MEMTINPDLVKVYRKAEDIAGAILEDDDDPEGKISERIARAAEWCNLGTDGDLTDAERKELRRLADVAQKLEAADAECTRTFAEREETPLGPGYVLKARNHAMAVERYNEVMRSI
jgi:ferric-dicitrate binding protein FerR (iron transport regulator)